MSIKIGTLNLCLGLKNKKTHVKNLILQNNIDVLCMQEIEIETNYDINLLSFKGYTLENELNSHKSRVGIYVKNGIEYKRQDELEGENSHLIIIDITDNKSTYRLINIYRSFNPQGGISAVDLFKHQLDLINLACNSRTIIIGDINLDFSKINDVNYTNRALFEEFETRLGHHCLIQMVNFHTWSRMVANTHKSSILDHIYVRDPSNVQNINSTDPYFGDHLLITFSIPLSKQKIRGSYIALVVYIDGSRAVVV